MKIKRPIPHIPIPQNAKRVYGGYLFQVFNWPQKIFDGRVKTYEGLKETDGVNIIAVTKDKKIIILRQRQPGTGEYLSLPGGRIDEGEEPLTAAKRELLEETGHVSGDWSLYKAIQPNTRVDWAIYAFVAKNCERVADITPDGGEIIKPMLLSFTEFLKIAENEKFVNIRLALDVLGARLNPVKMKKLKKKFGI